MDLLAESELVLRGLARREENRTTEIILECVNRVLLLQDMQECHA